MNKFTNLSLDELYEVATFLPVTDLVLRFRYLSMSIHEALSDHALDQKARKNCRWKLLIEKGLTLELGKRKTTLLLSFDDGYKKYKAEYIFTSLFTSEEMKIKNMIWKNKFKVNGSRIVRTALRLCLRFNYLFMLKDHVRYDEFLLKIHENDLVSTTSAGYFQPILSASAKFMNKRGLKIHGKNGILLVHGCVSENSKLTIYNIFPSNLPPMEQVSISMAYFVFPCAQMDTCKEMQELLTLLKLKICPHAPDYHCNVDLLKEIVKQEFMYSDRQFLVTTNSAYNYFHNADKVPVDIPCAITFHMNPLRKAYTVPIQSLWSALVATATPILIFIFGVVYLYFITIKTGFPTFAYTRHYLLEESMSLKRIVHACCIPLVDLGYPLALILTTEPTMFNIALAIAGGTYALKMALCFLFFPNMIDALTYAHVGPVEVVHNFIFAFATANFIPHLINYGRGGFSMISNTVSSWWKSITSK